MCVSPSGRAHACRYRRGYKNVIDKGIELNKQGVRTELMMETRWGLCGDACVRFVSMHVLAPSRHSSCISLLQGPPLCSIDARAACLHLAHYARCRMLLCCAVLCPGVPISSATGLLASELLTPASMSAPEP
jgi:hypothetical protein